MPTRKIFILTLVILLIFLSFSFGFYLGTSKLKVYLPPKEIDLSLFWETYYKLQEKFIDKEKIDNQKILYGAISGMVKSLGDPYTEFFEPQLTKRLMEDIKGKFEGIGIEIGIKKGELTVIAPLEGTPADRAGLKAGDKILKINDVNTFDLTLQEAVNLIRGPKDTPIVLTIYRKEWDQPKEIKIVREVIEVPSLKWEIIELENKENVGYLKIYHFNEKTMMDFLKIAKQIQKLDSQKIILDLRSNPGGYLEIAKVIAEWFLQKDNVVVIEQKRSGERKEYKTTRQGLFSNYKVVILVNEGTASGAEILAGALRDNRGIILIGEKTFGKGSIQTVENLTGGSSLKITVAYWLTPKGEKIAEKGLEPDIKIQDNPDSEVDEQLEKAKEIILNL